MRSIFSSNTYKNAVMKLYHHCVLFWYGRQDLNLHGCPLEPKSNVSANSTIPAFIQLFHIHTNKESRHVSANSSCCGTRYLPCRRCGCVSYRPRPLALVASSATGGAPIAPHTRIYSVDSWRYFSTAEGACQRILPRKVGGAENSSGKNFPVWPDLSLTFLLNTSTIDSVWCTLGSV